MIVPLRYAAAERRHRRDPHLAQPEAVQGLAQVRRRPAAPRRRSATSSGGAARAQPPARPRSARARAAQAELLAADRRARRLARGGGRAAAARAPPTTCWSRSATARSPGARGRRDPDRSVARRTAEAPAAPIPEAPPAGAAAAASGRSRASASQGEDDILVQFAKCCTPVPGDDDRRLHHPRPRRHRPHAATARRRSSSIPARRLDVAWDDEVEDAAPGRGPGHLHRPPGPAGADLASRSPSTG